MGDGWVDEVMDGCERIVSKDYNTHILANKAQPMGAKNWKNQSSTPLFHSDIQFQTVWEM